MHRITHDILRYLLITATIIAAALLPASCITDDADCPTPDATDPGRYRLQFRIVTRSNAESRAADIDGDVEGSAAENYINVNDVRYLIFDSNRKFVTDLSARATTVATNDRFTVYDVVADVSIPFFVDNLEGTLDFYILALANCTGWGMTMPALAEGDDMSAVFTDGLVLTTRPYTPALQLAATGGGATRQRFPMAGLQHFTVTGSLLLLGTSEGEPFDITASTGKNLNMLRTFSKIEVVDRINIPAGAVFDPVADSADVRIRSVQFNGFNNAGRLLPIFNIWGLNGTLETQQVIGASIPAAPDYHMPPALNADNSIDSDPALTDYALPFAYDAYATALRRDKCPVYSCYVYEFSNIAGTIPANQMPYFTVTTAEYVDPSTGQTLVQEQTYPMRLAHYSNGEATQLITSLLRNHLYRFEITGVHQDLTVSWTVCNMDQASADIEFN